MAALRGLGSGPGSSVGSIGDDDDWVVVSSAKSGPSGEGPASGDPTRPEAEGTILVGGVHTIASQKNAELMDAAAGERERAEREANTLDAIGKRVEEVGAVCLGVGPVAGAVFGPGAGGAAVVAGAVAGAGGCLAHWLAGKRRPPPPGVMPVRLAEGMDGVVKAIVAAVIAAQAAGEGGGGGGGGDARAGGACGGGGGGGARAGRA